MEINVSQQGDSHGVIQMIGQFWEQNEFNLFRKHIKELYEKGITRIVVDLSRVSFISSQGLGILVAVFSEVKNQKGDLILFKPKGCVKEVIEISGLDMTMKIAQTDEELELRS